MSAMNPVPVSNSHSSKKEGIVVFVHGFTGEGVATWAGFPHRVAHDAELGGYDYCFWGYPTQVKLTYALTQYFWEDDPNLETLGRGLRTLLDNLPSAYEKLVLVGHSMGGLVIQAFILEELRRGSHPHLDRLTEVLHYGTPSGGLAKAWWGSFLKNQVADMSDLGPFIQKLRSGWKQWIDDGRADPSRIARFRLTLVAGMKDKFVPPESSLDPFPFDEHELSPGNHTEMVKPDEVGELPFLILKRRLLRGNLTAAQRTLIYGESDEAIRQMNRVRAAVELGDADELLKLAGDVLAQSPPRVPRVERALGLALVDHQYFDKAATLLQRYLEFQVPDDGSRPFAADAQAVHQMAVALSELGDNLDALTRLDALPPEVRNLSETIGIRAGRLKREWLKNPGKTPVGRRALASYRTGFETAKTSGQSDQILYNGINYAYMTFALGESGYDTIADELLAACDAQENSDYWTDATRAEAYLLLRRHAKAAQAYGTALGQAPVPRHLVTTAHQALDIIRRQGDPASAQPIRLLIDTHLPLVKYGVPEAEEPA